MNFASLNVFAGQVLSHQALVNFLASYKRPNDKISELISQGVLIPIKRGLYSLKPALPGNAAHPILVANHLQGPSYVSTDYLLSIRGVIPERAYTITSTSLKGSAEVSCPSGNFSYRKVASAYYPLDIVLIELPGGLFGLTTSVEKALFDKIVTTPNLALRSIKDVEELLIEDWRLDEEILGEFDKRKMESWIPFAEKRPSLINLVKFLYSL